MITNIIIPFLLYIFMYFVTLLQAKVNIFFGTNQMKKALGINGSEDQITELLKDIRKIEDEITFLKEKVLKPAKKDLKIAERKLAKALCFCSIGDYICKNDGKEKYVHNILPSVEEGFSIVAKTVNSRDDSLSENTHVVLEMDQTWKGWKVIK